MGVEMYSYQALVYLIGYLVSSTIYLKSIEIILKRFTPLLPLGERGLELGKVIGILERLLILTACYTGQFSLIPMLLASKSIVRFPEISKDGAKSYAEYFLIGTLLSFFLAIMTGTLLTKYVQVYVLQSE